MAKSVKIKNKIPIYHALCSKCQKETEFRFIPPDDKDEKKFWLVYSICDKCKIVYAHGIHDKEPSIENGDFIIEYDKEISAGSKDVIQKLKKQQE